MDLWNVIAKFAYATKKKPNQTKPNLTHTSWTQSTYIGSIRRVLSTIFLFYTIIRSCLRFFSFSSHAHYQICQFFFSSSVCVHRKNHYKCNSNLTDTNTAHTSGWAVRARVRRKKKHRFLPLFCTPFIISTNNCRMNGKKKYDGIFFVSISAIHGWVREREFVRAIVR